MCALLPAVLSPLRAAEPVAAITGDPWGLPVNAAKRVGCRISGVRRHLDEGRLIAALKEMATL